MYWRNDDLKPNQVLKYLNKDSAHTKAKFEALPHTHCSPLLDKSNSVLDNNESTPLNELYSEHIAPLERAGLPLPKVDPTLKRCC